MKKFYYEILYINPPDPIVEIVEGREVFSYALGKIGQVPANDKDDAKKILNKKFPGTKIVCIEEENGLKLFPSVKR